jgi:hypothetical protein
MKGEKSRFESKTTLDAIHQELLALVSNIFKSISSTQAYRGRNVAGEDSTANALHCSEARVRSFIGVRTV